MRMMSAQFRQHGGTPLCHRRVHNPAGELGVLREAFVVAYVAAGVHAPADRALGFPTAGQDDEALGAPGARDDAQGEPETVAGPVDKVAGVAAVGPDLGDLRLLRGARCVPCLGEWAV